MKKEIFWTIIGVVTLKSLFYFTHHIQEDAYITWRVAQNMLDYGVIGFNGEERISATSTYLYTFISYLFNLVLGKEYFIIPLLLFNSVLYAIGTSWFGQIFYDKNREVGKIVLVIIVLNFLPPAIKISILGMEYGLLFFLFCSLLYHGLKLRMKWAFLFLPILIMWTRLDTAIFLGIVFLFDTFKNKRLNYWLIIGGIIGVVSVTLFNYYYFGDWVNNTIIAKSIAYPYEFRLKLITHYLDNYWGMVKIPEEFLQINWFTIVLLVVETIVFCYYIIQSMHPQKYILSLVFCFAWIKQLIFMSRLSLFDWYYWTPQIFLFSIIVIALLDSYNYSKIINNLIIWLILPMTIYQAVHSIATGNAEYNYRRNIGLYLNQYEKDKSQTIFLEPAGYIPYFSHLKTIDFVGLVDKGIQKELKKDNRYFIQPTLQDRKPRYYLAMEPKEKFKSKEDSLYFKDNYLMIKHFKIEDHLQSDFLILQKIYELKPSGRDYWLYRRYDSF